MHPNLCEFRRNKTKRTNSTILVHETNIPNSLFAHSSVPIQLPFSISDFQLIANKFQSVLMINSDDATFFNIRQATLSEARFSDEAGLSNAPPPASKPSTQDTKFMMATNTSRFALNNSTVCQKWYKTFRI